MTKAVFTHKANSIYDDRPEEHYHFPATYLRAVEQAIGDWIVYYEPRRGGGRQAYFAIARATGIRKDEQDNNLFYVDIEDYLPFPYPPHFKNEGNYFENSLVRDDGETNKGAFGRAVRLLPEVEFETICAAGFADTNATLGDEDWSTSVTAERTVGFADPPADFDRPIVERLTSRPFRDAAFARLVKAAYNSRCAITGLDLVNGGGRPEVEAAHIRPVEDHGPDTIRNGIALSRTAHWMFDRGLISISDDNDILINEQKITGSAASLIRPERKIILPKEMVYRPSPVYLQFHRAKHNFA